MRRTVERRASPCELRGVARPLMAQVSFIVDAEFSALRPAPEAPAGTPNKRETRRNFLNRIVYAASNRLIPQHQMA